MSLLTLPLVTPDCRRMSGVLNILGDKWTVMIVMVLRIRPHRFNDLKRSIGGVSQQMLTRALKALERDGMIVRTVYPTVPPQVEYALSGLGQSLARAIRELGDWAQSHMDEIEGNRSRYDGLGATRDEGCARKADAQTTA